MNYRGWPDSGELVVGKVDEIEDFGVFIDLVEYQDKRGLVHKSEVASGWIKNVSDHVSTGETVVAKVLDVDEESRQIDLSLKDVNEHQHRETIQEWKNEQKADNWMEIAFGEDLADDRYADIAEAIIEDHGSLYAGFEAAAIHGREAIADADLDDDTIEAIVQTARENVSVPFVTVTGYIDLRSPAPDGIEDVKDALRAAEGNGEVGEEVEIEVEYVGAPEYRIRVQAPDYNAAEDALEASADRAAASIEGVGGTGEFHRERRTDDE
jgi:translation initiation factor 2 subunit 1